MPRGNGMGPMGMGPKTGTGRGCGFGGGRGLGGQGRGRHGCRNLFLATGLPGWMRAGGGAGPERACGNIEKQALAIQAEALQSQLDDVKRRLEALGV